MHVLLKNRAAFLNLSDHLVIRAPDRLGNVTSGGYHAILVLGPELYHQARIGPDQNLDGGIMPTYSRLAEGPRANHNAPRARVMPAEYALPGRATQMRTIVRWAYTPGKTTLVKVGPRRPTHETIMAAKLFQLADRFGR